MVALTRPLYWSSDPVEASTNFYKLMSAIVDPSKEGLAYLRPMSPSGDARDQQSWLTGHDAQAWLDSRWEEVWNPLARRCEDSRQTEYEGIFDELAEYENVPRIFFDRRRLLACANIDNESLSSSASASYIIVTADWSFADRASILWSPQVVAAAHWPASPSLAPSSQLNSPEPSLDADTAANVLEDELYGGDIGLFDLIRESFGLGFAVISLPIEGFSTADIRPPIFYCVIPAKSETSPQDLTKEPWRACLRVVSKRALGIERIERHSVAAGIIDSQFLTYSYENSGDDFVRSYYLLAQRPGRQDLGESESHFCNVADQFAYYSTLLAQRTSYISWQLSEITPSLVVWDSSLSEAIDLTHELQELTALLPLTSRRRRKVALLMQQISLAFSGTRSRVSRSLAEVEELNDQWESDLRRTDEGLRERLVLDSLRDGSESQRRALGDLRTSLTASVSTSAGRSMSGFSSRLKRQMDEAGALWESMVQYEREESRAAQERQNQIVSIGLAGIAILTALPILIGSLSWADLENEAAGWSGPASAIRWFITSIHTPLLVSAIAATTLAITFLFLVLARSATSPFARRPGLVPLGAELQRMRALNQDAERLVTQLRMAGTEPSAGASRDGLLVALDRTDTQLCALVVRLWREYQVLRSRVAESSLGIDRIRTQIDALLLSQELFDVRPSPLWTPLTLCLYRYGTQSIVGTPIVSWSEFSRVMRFYGFGPGDRKRLDQIGSAASDMEPEQLVEHLRNSGVNVWRHGWIEESTDAAEALPDAQPLSEPPDSRSVPPDLARSADPSGEGVGG